MPARSKTLTAHVVTDGAGTRTDLYDEWGNFHQSIPPKETQPRFGRQQHIYLGGTYYALSWKRTPQTPALPQ